MGLEALTPEEKAQFYEALKAEMGGGEVCECEAKFEQVAEVLKNLADEIADIKETLYNKMIGGIQSLYDDNVRASEIGGLKEKYGSLFDPHMEAFGKMYPGADLYSNLYDQIGSMKGAEGYTDEMGDAKIKEIASQLQAIVEGIRGPVAMTAEIATPAEAPGERSEMDAIVDRVKRLKGKGRSSGIMPGADAE
jgi:hypothetical protein